MSGAFSVAVEGAVLSGEISQTVCTPAKAGASGLDTERSARISETPAFAAAPLVLVHGMAGERHDWDRLLAALPANLATLRYDLRGFGQSSAQQGISFSHSDDLLALLDARDIDRAPLVGLSMGGGIALNFALGHPERVSHLILISPSMIGWEMSDEWKALWRAIAEAARSGDITLARERWWNHPMFAVLREQGQADELYRAIQAYHGRQWFRDDQRDELPDIDRLHTLAPPTLLLSGTRDLADLRVIADVIEGAAPQVTRIDFAEAGHMLHMERPGEVAQAIADFLG